MPRIPPGVNFLSPTEITKDQFINSTGVFDNDKSAITTQAKQDTHPSIHEVLFHQSAQIVVLIKELAKYQSMQQIQSLVEKVSPEGAIRNSAINFVEDVLYPRYCPINKELNK